MGVPSSPPTSFGRRFRQELDAQGLGVRTVARRIADREGNPERLESIRRQLRRYLSSVDSVSPSAASRRLVEDALGLERDALADEDADEEDSAVDALMAKIRKLLVAELAA